MDKFYIIVLSIFTIFLILILTMIGTTIVYGDTALQYPPVVSQCPDYWKIDGNTCINTTNGINGVNSKNVIGNAYCNGQNCDIIPSDEKWLANGLTPICNQRKWANTNNIMWDGVSNYNSC